MLPREREEGGIQLSRVQTTRNARKGKEEGGAAMFPGGWLVVQQILNQRRSESGCGGLLNVV